MTPLLERAVADGVITPQQAAAIQALAPQRARLVPRGRVPLYAEVLGYLGSILVSAGAVSLVSQFWDEFDTIGRLLVLGGTALVLWAVGALVDDEVDPALRRLRSVMWLLATGAVAGFAGILSVDGFGWEGEPVAVTTGASVAVVSALLWRLQDRPAQHLSALVGTGLAVGGLGALADGAAAVGVGLWALGMVWLLGGLHEMLRPAFVALPLGAGLMLLGAAVTGGSWQGVGQILGLVTAGGLLGLGVTRAQFWVTGVGVIGLLIFVPGTATYFFADTIGVPLTFLVSGVVLLAGALYAFRRGVTLVDLTVSGRDDETEPRNVR